MTELDGKALVKADLLTGVAIALLGLAVLVLSLGMPTFADRGVNPLTAPGHFSRRWSAPRCFSAAGCLRCARWAGSGQSDRTGRPPAPAASRHPGLMLVAVALVGRHRLPPRRRRIHAGLRRDLPRLARHRAAARRPDRRGRPDRSDHRPGDPGAVRDRLPGAAP